MVHITIGNTFIEVDGGFRAICALRENLKVETDYTERRSSGFKIPKWEYFISSSGKTYTGLLRNVKLILTKKGIRYKVTDNRDEFIPPSVETIKDALSTIPFKLRDYQLDALLRITRQRKGIVKIATGGGKTIVLSTVAKSIGRKTAIVVNSKDLARQLRVEVAKYWDVNESEIGMIGGGRTDIGDVSIVMIQTAHRMIKRKNKGYKNLRKQRALEWLLDIEAVIVDEVHNAQSKSFQRFIEQVDPTICYGFSATPIASPARGADGEEISRDIVLASYFRSKVIDVKTSDLVDMGFLAKPTVKMIQNPIVFSGYDIISYADEFEMRVLESRVRNHKICKVVSEHYHKGENAVIFVDRINHCYTLAEMLTHFGVSEDEVAYVNGEVCETVRREAIQSFKDGQIRILIGTVLNEGIDFLAEVAFNAAAGRSTKKVIQRVGRALRKKTKNPETGDVCTETEEHVTYYDFYDTGHPFFWPQTQKRLEVYKEEGHDVKIIKVEQ